MKKSVNKLVQLRKDCRFTEEKEEEEEEEEEDEEF